MTDAKYAQAVNDFLNARRKADLREVFARLTGESTELLSYEEVRQKLKVIEGSRQELKDIPLDAIIGSVGRYSDFTRDFLPRLDSDQSRWTKIMVETIGTQGLPPIDVYQIGEAYFVLDGNHRVSVAHQLGSSHIQAYVTQVRTRVPLSPDTQPDDLIIKAEYVHFLDTTQIDRLRPEANLEVTIPGQYPILEEHISVHRYFMGIDQNHEIPYQEAVTHWFDEVYLAVIEIIRERGILAHFTNRTETDLYLWLAEHRAQLEDALGWKIDTDTAAENLLSRFAPDFHKVLAGIAKRILDIVTPDSLESGPPIGQWRQEISDTRSCECMFDHTLVALNEDPQRWYALDQALVLAQRDGSQLRGLHVLPHNEDDVKEKIEALKTEFQRRCAEANVSGELAIEYGNIARQISERAHWADLVITHLSHPPGDKPTERLSSGFHTLIRRCPRPILAVPGNVTLLNRALLAYTDSPKAEEALYIAAYMASKWGIHLTVLTIDHEDQKARKIQKPARQYLKELGIQSDFILHESGSQAEIILKTCANTQSDLILIGGYKAGPVVEVMIGSVVDQILRETRMPVLICR
jgi:nucleotide-binding universal stress UspA family protein